MDLSRSLCRIAISERAAPRRRNTTRPIWLTTTRC